MLSIGSKTPSLSLSLSLRLRKSPRAKPEPMDNINNRNKTSHESEKIEYQSNKLWLKYAYDYQRLVSYLFLFNESIDLVKEH